MSDLREEIRKRLPLSENLTAEEIKDLIDRELQIESKKHFLGLKEREQIGKDIFNSIRKLDILENFIEDQTITEIMVNGTEGIFVERGGILSLQDVRFESKEELRRVIYKITADCNRTVNDSSPIVDARLPDGARVNVVLDPVALNGPILTIRRFPEAPITMENLLSFNTLTEECADFLKSEVEKGSNILVSGGTGTGKTTFLNVLSEFIPANERVITIEDSAELQLRNLPNLVRMETRNANVEGCREITIRDLIKASLRMRPDRILVGEVRSREAIDMLQSVNVGHSAMTTVHANSVRDVVSRLETMVLMGMEMPLEAIRGQIVSGFDLIVQLKRFSDGSRKVVEIARPEALTEGNVFMKTLYLWERGSLIWKDT